MRRSAALHAIAAESLRYAAASGVALAADFGTYVALIRVAGVHYLIAAPLGFLLGLAVVYGLSVRWVFSHRRYSDRRAELGLFAIIGLAGVLLNQVLVYTGVEGLALSYESAKLVSAGFVFFFNFALRKRLLFMARS